MGVKISYAVPNGGRAITASQVLDAVSGFYDLYEKAVAALPVDSTDEDVFRWMLSRIVAKRRRRYNFSQL